MNFDRNVQDITKGIDAGNIKFDYNTYMGTGMPPTYGGADTSLWFVSAAWQYLRYSGFAPADVSRLLPPLLSIIDTSTRWPCPVVALSSSAASTPARSSRLE